MKVRNCLLAIAALLPVLSGAQSQFVPGKTAAQLRDAVVDGGTGRLYAAVYDEHQVWVYDPATLERLAQVPVGRGPVALALSPDGAVLACVNRLDNSVSLIGLPEEKVLATVAVGEGPTAVAALADGQFVVANTFGDSVSLVKPSSTEAVTLAQEMVGVPVGVAAAGATFAVIGRATSSVAIFDHSGQRVATATLPGPPQCIAALGDRYAVGTAAELLLVEPGQGGIEARASAAVSSLSADGGSLFALDGAGIVKVFDAGLASAQEFAVPADTRRLVVSHGVQVAIAPQVKAWQVANTAGLSVHALAALAEPASPVATAPAAVAVVEAVSTEAPAALPETDTPSAPEPVSPEPLAPEPVTPEPAAETAAPAPAAEVAQAEPAPAVPLETSAAAEVTEAPAEPETPATEAAAASVIPDEVAPSPGSTVRKHPIRTDSVGAPRAGSRPSAVPMRQLSRKTIADALVQPTEFGSEDAGFQPPDWTEPLRDIEFEEMKPSSSDLLDVSGNVHLRWGETYFRSDAFTYDKAEGLFHARGDIEITQRDSRLTADEFTYTVPDPATLASEAPTVFSPAKSEQEQAKDRLTLGRIMAKNIYVDEPTRAMRAESLDYDFATQTGELLHVHGKAGIYYYSADKLRILGPASVEGDEVWVTTCDRDPPHYKVRLSKAQLENGQALGGTNARLQLGKMDTPFYLPKWGRGGSSGAYPWTFDFDSGRQADIGYYVNMGQRYEITPDLALGPRLFITEKEGVGFGGDVAYDFRENPASWMYRSSGEAHGIYTTEDRGYLHLYHRYDYDENLTVRVQAEQWSDSEFYKDFFYDQYRNRSRPRTFANVTYRTDDYIATATARLNTHSWAADTERTPEATFHVPERQLAGRLYLTFDTINGYNDREPAGPNGARSVNILRLSYDWDVAQALSIVPFTEFEGTWYSRQQFEDSSATRFASQVGVTAQTRFHREYPGRWGFSAFKHVVVPSVTYSYQPESSLDVAKVPRFDSLDNVFGRSRLETKLDNIVYGRDAESKDVWQVARLTLYQGNDLWNEIQKSADYEMELDVRPRPWGGFQLVAERHDVSGDLTFYRRDTEEAFVGLYERVFGRPFDRDEAFRSDRSFEDYNRVLAQLYYDEMPLNARIGFAYTETRSEVFNREVLYGVGYEINEKWGVGFEHRYDFEDGTLRTQTYEIRRSLHCWETALRVRDRESGFDVDLEFSIKAFPGTRLKF